MSFRSFNVGLDLNGIHREIYRAKFQKSQEGNMASVSHNDSSANIGNVLSSNPRNAYL